MELGNINTYNLNKINVSWNTNITKSKTEIKNKIKDKEKNKINI